MKIKRTKLEKTGSRVYGKPTKDSDYDYLWRCGQWDEWLRVAAFLLKRGFEFGGSFDSRNGLPRLDDDEAMFISFKRGPLNIIVVTDDDQWERWLVARAACVAEAPIDRDRAVVLHTRYGVGPEGNYTTPLDELLVLFGDPRKPIPKGVIDARRT